MTAKKNVVKPEERPVRGLPIQDPRHLYDGVRVVVYDHKAPYDKRVVFAGLIKSRVGHTTLLGDNFAHGRTDVLSVRTTLDLVDIGVLPSPGTTDLYEGTKRVYALPKNADPFLDILIVEHDPFPKKDKKTSGRRAAKNKGKTNTPVDPELEALFGQVVLQEI